MMHQVYLGLGTNLGQRQHNLEQAVASLREVVRVTAVSAMYETTPWGYQHQAAFLNACLSGQTELSPQKLLQFSKNLEITMGRTPTVRWGPRLIDIDLLLYDEVVMQTAALTLPHPHLHERAFVLIPLAEIAADVVHPEVGQTIGALAAAMDSSGMHRLPVPLGLMTDVMV